MNASIFNMDRHAHLRSHCSHIMYGLKLFSPDYKTNRSVLFEDSEKLTSQRIRSKTFCHGMQYNL